MSVRGVVFTEIVCLVFMTGCGCGTEPGTTRAERVDRDRSSLSTNGIEDLMSMLGGPPARVIGLLDGAGPERFGTIERVLVQRSGNVFILDRDGLQLTWFGIDGGFRGVFGREGEGPGEFRRVKSLAFGAEGEVVVFDSWLRKLVFLVPGE